MKSTALLEQCENLTHRKLDYWCHHGIFTERHEGDRRAQRRDFTDEDLKVAQVLSRVSHAFDAWSNGRGGLVAIYKEIADQVRAGAITAYVHLAPGVDIYVTVDPEGREAPATGRPLEGIDVPSDGTQVELPAEEPPAEEPVEEPVEEPGFVPGVGVDNG